MAESITYRIVSYRLPEGCRCEQDGLDYTIFYPSGWIQEIPFWVNSFCHFSLKLHWENLPTRIKNRLSLIYPWNRIIPLLLDLKKRITYFLFPAKKQRLLDLVALIGQIISHTRLDGNNLQFFNT